MWYEALGRYFLIDPDTSDFSIKRTADADIEIQSDFSSQICIWNFTLCVYLVSIVKNPQILHMANLATAELCDTYQNHITDGGLRVLQPIFQSYGSRKSFCGPIATLKVFEDNVIVREMIEEPGKGRVLLVDGGGSLRCALLGGNLALLAQNNGWNGIIVNGCIRDVEEINRCDIGVRALATHPLKSNKKGVGDKNGVVFIGGTRIAHGEWCCADSDGVIISPTELSL